MTTCKDIDPRGFLLNDNDSGVDHLGESTYADAIAWSVHHVDSPITIGLFAKWGSGKSFLLRHMQSILKKYQRQEEIDNAGEVPENRLKGPKSRKLWIFWTFLLVLLFILTLFLAIKPDIYQQIFGNEIKPTTEIITSANRTLDLTSESLKTASIVGMVLFSIELLVVILLGCCGKSWLSSSHYGNCWLLAYGAFTKLPVGNPHDDIIDKPGAHTDQVFNRACESDDARLPDKDSEKQSLPRNYIFVDFKAWEYAGSDKLWAGIVTKIVEAIEKEFGAVTARMFRMLTIEEIPRDVLRRETGTIFIEVESDWEESDVSDVMKQYGALERPKKIKHPGNKELAYWQIKYSSASECQTAKECLKIEGVKYTENNPAFSVLNGKPDSHKLRHRHSNKKSNEMRISDCMKKRSAKNKKEETGREKNTVKSLNPTARSFLSARFWSHFAEHPAKLLCLPRLVWWILIFLCCICVPVGAYVIAIRYNLVLFQTYKNVPVIGQILLWLPGGAAIATFAIKFVWAMCHSQRKRINAALDGTKANMAGELGFMSKVKNEIEMVAKLVQCAGFTHQKVYKIVITIDDLDRVPLHKIQSVLEAVNILLSDKWSPFICFIAIDPRIVSKCIEKEMGTISEQSKITGHEYLKKIINLPICLPPITDCCKKRFLAGLIDQSDRTINYRKAELKNSSVERGIKTQNIHECLPAAEEDCLDGLQSHDVCGNQDQNAALSNQITAKTQNEESSKELNHGEFLFHCRKYIYENKELYKHIHGNPRNMKRLFNVISLTASIINCFLKKQKRRALIQSYHVANEEKKTLNKKEERNEEEANEGKKEEMVTDSDALEGSQDPENIKRTKNFAEDLVQWIILTDQWPYRTCYILQVIVDAEQRQAAGLNSGGIPTDWTIFDIYQKKVKDKCEKGDTTLLSLDAEPDLFCSYIRLLGKKDFTVCKIQKLQKYIVNLDYTIQHFIPARSHKA